MKNVTICKRLLVLKISQKTKKTCAEYISFLLESWLTSEKTQKFVDASTKNYTLGPLQAKLATFKTKSRERARSVRAQILLK